MHDYVPVLGQHKESISIYPSAQGMSESVGSSLEAQERVLLSCDICVGMKVVLAQSTESSSNLPALTCQHTPWTKKAGDEILLPSAIWERQLLTAGSDSTAEGEQEGKNLLPSEQLYALPLPHHCPELSENRPYGNSLLSLVFPLRVLAKWRRRGNTRTEETDKHNRGDSKEISLKKKEPEKRQEIIHLVMHSSQALYEPLDMC